MILDVIAYLGIFLLLVNTIQFFKGFSNNGKAFKIFAIYLGSIFLIQISASVLKSLSINNLFLSHFYFILQFILLSIFYLNLNLNEIQKKNIKIGLFFTLSLLIIQYCFDSSQFFKFNLFEIFITSFLIIIYTVFYLYNLLDQKEKKFYYVNLGILIYLFGSTVFFLAGDLLTLNALRFEISIWVLNALLFVVYQILIFVEWKKNFSLKEIKNE
jgi:hypothetical protein